MRKMRPEFELKASTRRALGRSFTVGASGAGNVSLLVGGSELAKRAHLARIAKAAGRTVYRVDCSKLFSEYIGETEKNIASLFAKAERAGWTLFFDEADALFGNRSAVRDSHGRYANQEVSYLLRRMGRSPAPVVVSVDDVKGMKRSFLRICQAPVAFR